MGLNAPTTDLGTLSAKLDLVLAEVRAMSARGKPGMTQRAFAKELGVHPRTVCRMVRRKEIRLVKGRVPQSEAAKFLS